MSRPIARPDIRHTMRPSTASCTKPGRLALLLVALVGAIPAARADCELLYAPSEVRARLLAFHHANEARRAQEYHDGAGSAPRRAAPTRPDTVVAHRPGRADDARSP